MLTTLLQATVVMRVIKILCIFQYLQKKEIASILVSFSVNVNYNKNLQSILLINLLVLLSMPGIPIYT